MWHTEALSAPCSSARYLSYLKATISVYADGRLRTAAGHTVVVEQDSAGRPLDSKQRDEREDKRRFASHFSGASRALQ